MELTIEVTNECNNKCVHCSSNSGKGAKPERILKVSEVIDAIESVRPEKVILSGGEPFLYPHLEEVIRVLKRRGIVIGINTCANFRSAILPPNALDIDEFYVSYFCIDNERITRCKSLNDPLFFALISKMNGKRVWINTVIFDDLQMNDIAGAAYAIGLPVHVMKLVKHGRAVNIDVPPVGKQREIAGKILDQLDPDRLKDRIPGFLAEDGYDEHVFPAIADEAEERLRAIHPLCKISHSLLGGRCRSKDKRTLLSDGRLIGCVAGKGIDERFDAVKVCER